MLVDIFSGKEVTRVIDFFIDNVGGEYTKTDVAEGSMVSRPTVQDIVQKLTCMDVICSSRKLGHTELYKLNTKSPLVKSLISFDSELSRIMFENGIESMDGAETGFNAKQTTVESTSHQVDDVVFEHVLGYGWANLTNEELHHGEKLTVPVLNLRKRTEEA